MMTLLRFCTVVVLLTAADLAAAEDVWMSRVSARQSIGDGLGYRGGYTSLDWFLPLLPDGEDTLWFGDFRAILSTNAEFSSNVGTGYRWYDPDTNRIWGISAYWDTRQQDSFSFNQAGMGLESFGEFIDLELNGYTPAVSDPHQQAVSFRGSNLLVHTAAALSGLDFLAGYNVPAILGFRTRVLGGLYYFDSGYTPDATGWRVRIETVLKNHVAFTATAQDDDLFGRTVTVSVELRQTLRHDANPAAGSMRRRFRNADGGGHDRSIRHRLADPVRRHQQIVLVQNTQTARDLTSMPLTFIHVVPGSAGTGTFENPYGTITDALADPLAPTSVIYTPQGGSFIEDVALVPGTQLRSNGPVQIIPALQGPLRLPRSGTGDNLAELPAEITGDVTLADSTVVSGFSVIGTVSAAAVTDATMESGRIRQPLAMDAVTLTDSTGILLDNLLIDQSGNRGLRIDNSSADVTDVTFSTITDDAIEINSGAAGTAVTLDGVSITDAMAEGIDINPDGAGDLEVTITSTGISADQTALSVTEGAAATGDVTLSVTSTTASSVNAGGIIVDGSAGAGTTFVSVFQDNSVPAALTDGVVFRDVTFDAVPGGALDPVLMSTLAVGASTGRITGTGIVFDTAVGDVDLGDVDVFNMTGTGLFVTASPGLVLRSQTGSSVDSLTGAALDLTDVTVDLVFDSVISVDSPGRAASFDTVDGALAVTTTAATDAASPPFLYTNIPSPFSVFFGNTTINSLQGPLIGDNESRVGAVGGLPAAAAIYDPLQIFFP